MCVKSLVDKAAFEAVGDDCRDLDNFCAAVETVFTHRIQVRWRVFGGSSESQSFWPLLSRLAPPITVASVQDMENITSDIGRCRAWIRLMLVQKRLSDFMTSLLRKQDHLQLAQFLTTQAQLSHYGRTSSKGHSGHSGKNSPQNVNFPIIDSIYI